MSGFEHSGPVILILGLVVGVVWLCLPFAMFGIKPRLNEQTALLRAILAQLEENAPPEPAPDLPVRNAPAATSPRGKGAPRWPE